jgi:nucleoid DNA-binding protein
MPQRINFFSQKKGANTSFRPKGFTGTEIKIEGTKSTCFSLTKKLKRFINTQLEES